MNSCYILLFMFEVGTKSEAIYVLEHGNHSAEWHWRWVIKGGRQIILDTNTTLQNHGYQYNLDGDLTAWTQSATLGAPASPPAQRRWDLQYDALGELTDLKATLTGGAATNTAPGSMTPPGT